MKRSKLFSLLALGLFLSMASLAFVNTAEAKTRRIGGGPMNTPKTILIDEVTFLYIDQIDTPPEPEDVFISIRPADGDTLDGITVLTNTEDSLSGYYQEVDTPYVRGGVALRFTSSERRRVIVEWWLRY